MKLQVTAGLFTYQRGEFVLVFVGVEDGDENGDQCNQEQQGRADANDKVTDDFAHIRRAALSGGPDLK